MSAIEIAQKLRQAGAVVQAHGDRLYVDASRGLLTPERREILRQHKLDVISWLNRTSSAECSLDDAIAQACTGLGVEPAIVRAALSDDDIADHEAGILLVEALRDFAKARRDRCHRETGQLPLA